MICMPEKAKDYRCCQQDKQCEGEGCMAWVKETNFIRMSAEGSSGTHKETGKGYCGLLKYG